jgi:hypothetical protein
VRHAPAPAASGPPLVGGLLTLQRQAGNAAVASALDARPVRRAAGAHSPTPDCPGYEPGEVKKSQTDFGVLFEDVHEGPASIRVSDFGVNQSVVKETVKKHPIFQGFLAAVESNTTVQLDVLGTDDCVGPTGVRDQIRDQRAKSVAALLGPGARARVRFAGAAPTEDFTERNLTKVDRARNRAAVIQFNQKLDIQPRDVPIDPAPPRDTTDCNSTQVSALMRAHKLAIVMAERALEVVSKYKLGTTPEEIWRRNQVDFLLRKYFNTDSYTIRPTVAKGLEPIVNSLKSIGGKAADYECGGFLCDNDSHAYIWPFIANATKTIHVCPHGFGNEAELAATIVHEVGHMFAWHNVVPPQGETYCEGGCPSGLSSVEAANNSDSYSEFAQEVVTRGL